MKSLTPAQCRMARAALQWSMARTAHETGVNRSTVYRFENDIRYSEETACLLKEGYLRTGRIAFPDNQTVTHSRIPQKVPQHVTSHTRS